MKENLKLKQFILIEEKIQQINVENQKRREMNEQYTLSNNLKGKEKKKKEKKRAGTKILGKIIQHKMLANYSSRELIAQESSLKRYQISSSSFGNYSKFFLLLLLFTPLEFFTSVLTDGFP